jgi:hypothetical protein
MDKMYFDSRFVFEDDLFHCLFQICVLFVLATAVLHIRSVDVLSHPDKNISMFVFSLLLVINRILVSVRSMEIYFFFGSNTDSQNSGCQGSGAERRFRLHVPDRHGCCGHRIFWDK